MEGIIIVLVVALLIVVAARLGTGTRQQEIQDDIRAEQEWRQGRGD